MEQDFYTIKEKLGQLNEKNGYTIEINIIEYTGGKEKLDIRKWNRNEDRMLKGIALNFDEAKKLKQILDDYFKEK